MDINTISSFWANDFFGCSLTDIQSENDNVYPHRYLTGYNGLFVMRIHNKYMVSAPDEMVSDIKQIVNKGYDLFDISVYQNFFPNLIERCIGPSWIGYIDKSANQKHSNSVTVLSKADEYFPIIFNDFQKNFDETEWSHSGIDENSEYIAVHYIDNRIVSAASYELWGEKIAHIGIITHPLYRNKGYASMVLLSLSDFIISKNLTPQYRTLCSNLSAMKVAKNCGYAEYATHISIRLK